MVSSSANTVTGYLAELPPERRAVVAAVRKLVRRHLPKGYRETMGYGMIVYEVPLKQYPGTRDGKPLAYLEIDAVAAEVASAAPDEFIRLHEASRT